MKSLFWFFLIPIFLIISIFSINNQEYIALNLNPFPFIINLPTYLIVLIIFFLGFAIGSLMTWISQFKWKKLAKDLIQHFLRHAVRDGFFHADMHQGNLFVEKDGAIIPVDFGIMGRLDKNNRKYLAEILYGFIKRDYKKVAEVHFIAGLVLSLIHI